MTDWISKHLQQTIRSYNRWAKEMIFVYRLSGGMSIGSNKQNFLLGGTEGWMNYRLATSEIPISNVEDFAFLTQVLPLRGYDYAQQIGTKFAIANMEFRFPLIQVSYIWRTSYWFFQHSWYSIRRYGICMERRSFMAEHLVKIPMMAR